MRPKECFFFERMLQVLIFPIKANFTIFQGWESQNDLTKNVYALAKKYLSPIDDPEQMFFLDNSPQLIALKFSEKHEAKLSEEQLVQTSLHLL